MNDEEEWEASQPKWTYCKDGMPDTEGNYLWLHADKSIHLEHYWTNLTLMPYVIAWMSLPEAQKISHDYEQPVSGENTK